MPYQRLVEPLLPEQLAVPPRLEQAVGEEHGRGSGLEGQPRRLLPLVALDAESETGDDDRLWRFPRRHDPRRRVAGRGAGELAGARVDDQVEQGHELPGRDLAEHDLVRRSQELARLRVLAR